MRRMDHDLVGDLMNSLEPDEHRLVESYVRAHADVASKVDRLRQMLVPLAADADMALPPSSLAFSTVALVAEFKTRPPLPPPKPPGPRFRPQEWLRIMRRLDL